MKSPVGAVQLVSVGAEYVRVHPPISKVPEGYGNVVAPASDGMGGCEETTAWEEDCVAVAQFEEDTGLGAADEGAGAGWDEGGPDGTMLVTTIEEDAAGIIEEGESDGMTIEGAAGVDTVGADDGAGKLGEGDG